MKIEIEISPIDVVKYGEQHERPITTEAAGIGLARARQKAETQIAWLRREVLSKALDYARSVRVNEGVK